VAELIAAGPSLDGTSWLAWAVTAGTADPAQYPVVAKADFAWLGLAVGDLTGDGTADLGFTTENRFLWVQWDGAAENFVLTGRREVPSGPTLELDDDRQRRRAEVDVGLGHALLLAQRALQLDRAIGAVHAGDVQQAPFAGPLVGCGKIEWSVLVHCERTVILAVRGGADAAREPDDVGVAEQVFVVADVDEAASEVRVDGVHALEAEQLASDLVDAALAVALAWQHQGQVDAALGHDDSAASWCRTCSRVISRSCSMCASSGE